MSSSHSDMDLTPDFIRKEAKAVVENKFTNFLFSLEHSCEGEKKSIKLAEDEDIEGLLLPLFPELDDSGIDSDSTELLESQARRLEGLNGNLSDASSSAEDDDQLGRPWWDGIDNNDNFDKSKGDDIFKAMEDGRINPLDIAWPMGHRQPITRQFKFEDFRPERASPPLYEVELTASEEDDDASVLELVIPMHSSRYKRVPTVSPKKAKPKPKFHRSSFFSSICCLRW